MTVSHSFCQRTEREISPLHFFPRWQRSLRTKNRKIIKIIFSVSLKSSVSVCLSPSVTIQVPKLPPVPSVPQNRVPESTTVLLSRVLKGIYVTVHTLFFSESDPQHFCFLLEIAQPFPAGVHRNPLNCRQTMCNNKRGTSL